MTWFDDLSFHLFVPRHRGIEILQFKQKENIICIRSKLGITKWTVLMLHLPIVQLEDQISVRDQSLIIRSAVAALTPKQTLIPTTARLDVMHANEWL